MWVCDNTQRVEAPSDMEEIFVLQTATKLAKKAVGNQALIDIKRMSVHDGFAVFMVLIYTET